EQLAAGAGARAERHMQRLELRLDLLGVTAIADLTRVARATDLGDLPLGALRPSDRRTTRDQEVAAVPVGHVDDVAGQAEPGHLTSKDQLHRSITEPSTCRAAAPSRGRS